MLFLKDGVVGLRGALWGTGPSTLKRGLVETEAGRGGCGGLESNLQIPSRKT